MAFDPFLYVAFAAGFVAGRLIPWRSPWIPRATILTVIALVGLLGASLNDVPLSTLAITVPVALGFAVLLLAATAALALVIARRGKAPDTSKAREQRRERVPLSLMLVAAVLVGFGAGRLVSVPTATSITFTLYLLLALVAFDLPLRASALRNVWQPLTAAVVGAVMAAFAFSAITGTSLPVALGTSLAFGWYTLAGPLVLARAGAALGLLAFLTNFLRENLTMVFSPVVGPRLGGEGLSALGGATSMDTTLYFISRYGDADAGSLALATGLVLTIVASLVVPAVLALPL